MLDGEQLTGVTVGERYQILRCIGQGGMGRVYLARHTEVSRHFAIKILFGAVAASDKARRRFRQEAEAASRLDHPNLVPVIDYGTWDGQPFLVMDYVKGISLADLIDREAPMAPARVIALARPLAAGLQHAHERGLVHRDFKPSNVVVARDGDEEVPRILDFGLAIVADTDDHRLTTEGLVLGTPAFMSPEQACGEPIDQRTDLFALGLQMYKMLAGKHPFEGTPASIARQNLAAAVPPFRKRAPDVHVPSGLEAVVFRLLEKEPENRYSTAGDVIAALDALAGSRRRATHRPEVSDPPPSRRRRQPLAVLLATGLAFGVGTWWLSRESTPPSVASSALEASSGEPEASSGARSRPPAHEPRALSQPAAAPVEATSQGAPPEPAADELAASDASVRTRAVAVPDPEPVPEPTRREPAPAPAAAQPAPARDTQPARARRSAAAEPPAPAAEPPATTSAANAAGAESAEVSFEDFVARYREVGEQVDKLERMRGATAAQALRDRYLAIPYSGALRSETLRAESYRALAGIARELRGALRQ